MTTILSIETATTICSVAIHQNGKVLASADLFLEKSHSGALAILIEQLLSHCELDFKNLNAIAVSSGPGSYTGLRIGLSTAKGLCFALSIPIISVSSLDAMTLEVMNFIPKEDKTIYIPMLDARRMEVFYKILGVEFNEIEPLSNLIIEENSFDAYLIAYEKIILFGDGAVKAKEMLKARPKLRIVENVNPSAVFMGAIAHQKYEKGQFENLAYFEPNYGKEFYSPISKKKSFL
jgi:tRNA threonylcarbamoyladenosine biosynthesis protein TsaB